MAYSIGPNGIDLNGTTLDGPEDLGAPTTFNSVGSYAFMSFKNRYNPKAVGSTESGSQLVYDNSTGDNTNGVMYVNNNDSNRIRFDLNNGVQPSGTWRNMGPGKAWTDDSSNTGGYKSVNLWVRTA